MDEKSLGLLDFDNTEIAFEHKSDKELKKLHFLFSLMNKRTLVSLGSLVTPIALKINFPFIKSVVETTIFNQFVGGHTLLDTQKNIDELYRFNTLTILDYGAESKTSEEDLDKVMNENIKAIELAASNSSVPVISTKLTGLAPNDLLINMQSNKELSEGEQRDKMKLENRLSKICERAHDLDVGVMIDAEESWMQDTIDSMVEDMMRAYNQSKNIVYNTFQLYRHDKLEYLKSSFEKAQNENYILGAKLVRGAYLKKENEYAKEHGIQSCVHSSKENTDTDFNQAIAFCVNNYQGLASVCASHNQKSSLFQAKLIEEKSIDKTHPHINFCQLFGMSDNITFNLAKAGFNVAKYVPYGPLKEVVPYLIRRAQENSSVTGDMSRELKLITKEMKRRGV